MNTTRTGQLTRAGRAVAGLAIAHAPPKHIVRSPPAHELLRRANRHSLVDAWVERWPALTTTLRELGHAI